MQKRCIRSKKIERHKTVTRTTGTGRTNTAIGNAIPARLTPCPLSRPSFSHWTWRLVGAGWAPWNAEPTNVTRRDGVPRHGGVEPSQTTGYGWTTATQVNFHAATVRLLVLRGFGSFDWLAALVYQQHRQ